MKNRFYAAIAIVAVVFTVSCKKGGMSEETKTKMTTFEAGWKTMSDQMTTWGTTMNTTMDEMNKMMHESMGGDMSKDMKMDSASQKMCDDVMMKMDAMKATYKTTMDSVNANMAQYTEWKKTMMEEKDDAATSAGLDMWNAKLTGYQTMMADWTPALAGMKDACTMACDMMMKDMHSDMKMK